MAGIAFPHLSGMFNPELIRVCAGLVRGDESWRMDGEKYIFVFQGVPDAGATRDFRCFENLGGLSRERGRPARIL